MGLDLEKGGRSAPEVVQDNGGPGHAVDATPGDPGRRLIRFDGHL